MVSHTALCGSRDCPQGSSGLPAASPIILTTLLWVTLLPPAQLVVSSISLTYQARYVRVAIPRRTMHASCESPCHLSAKHHILGACLPLMAPFRSMLLTLRSGPQCLAPRAHGVPVYPVVFRHSYRELSRRKTPVAKLVRNPSRPAMPKPPASAAFTPKRRA